MTRKLRTIPGKIIIFFLTVFSLIVILVSVFGFIFMLEEDVYTESRESSLSEYAGSLAYNEAYNLFHNYYRNESERLDSINIPNFKFSINDYTSGRLLCSSGEEVTDDKAQYTFYPTEFRTISHTEYWNEDGSYVTYVDEDPTVDIWTDLSFHAASKDDETVSKQYIMKCYYEGGVPDTDDYYLVERLVDIVYSLRYAILPIGIVALVLFAVCYVTLMCITARGPEDEEVHPGLLNRMPIDVLIALCIAAMVGLAAIIIEIGYSSDVFMAIGIMGVILIGLNIFLGLSMSVAGRIKDGSLLRNTLIWKCCLLLWKLLTLVARGIRGMLRGIFKGIAQLPLIWKTVLATFVICFTEVIVIFVVYYGEDIFIFWFVEHLILVPVIFYIVIQMRRLEKGGAALASGDTEYKVNTRHMFWNLKRHGENLNNIAEGITIAVNDRMKSERMKTELITNVSHDIKTPLTSIINYADLIGKEESDNPKITEYAEVLTRQSARLKRLIEDLVEASKASSGNLEVQLAPCGAGIFVDQIAGEYEEKLGGRKLSLVTRVPDKELRIMADGRRMLRVFDNLMNNICKYAQEGTRVYLTLEERDGNAVFSFKNTSRDALDISPEELMERFVRGDKSRNTEGNGLGLSIARSLTELQGGTFDISVDGDLFKAVLQFRLI